MTEEEFRKCHGDPVWRLHHLYWVKAADTGKAVPFVPKSEQRTLIEAVYVKRLRNILVPKARQLGISTVISLDHSGLFTVSRGRAGGDHRFDATGRDEEA